MERKLNCEICGVVKPSRNKLRRHIQEQHSARIKCPLCTRFTATARTMYRMRRHLVNVHQVEAANYFNFRRYTTPHGNPASSPTKTPSVSSLLSLSVQVPAVYQRKVQSSFSVVSASSDTVSACTTSINELSSLFFPTNNLEIIKNEPVVVPCSKVESKTPDKSFKLASPSSLYTPPNPATPADPMDSSFSINLESPVISLAVCDGEVTISSNEPNTAMTANEKTSEALSTRPRCNLNRLDSTTNLKPEKDTVPIGKVPPPTLRRFKLKTKESSFSSSEVFQQQKKLNSSYSPKSPKASKSPMMKIRKQSAPNRKNPYKLIPLEPITAASMMDP